MADTVDEHYKQADLTERIKGELLNAGLSLAELRPDDLAGVDEFHLGGRSATEAILAGLPELTSDSRVLDVGCGIGGVARTVASRIGCSVTGVDLTPEFVTTAGDLSAAVGMADSTTFSQGNALELPFDDGSFDTVLMFHVGMNVGDKDALMAELARVTSPGGSVVVYDLMRIGDGDITFPVPWSSHPSTSFLAAPNDYRASMVAAGLVPKEAVDRMDVLGAAGAAAQQDPPPVNLSHLMGSNWPTMFTNLRAALSGGILSPTQISATRPLVGETSLVR